MDLEVKASGRGKTPYGLELSSDFWLQGTFLHMCRVSLILERGKWRSLNPLLRQDFAFLCPCHDYFLEMLTRDKDWLFTLFLLLLPFQRANRRLVVNSSTGAHLSLVSGNAKRRLAGCKCPTRSPSVSFGGAFTLEECCSRVVYVCSP